MEIKTSLKRLAVLFAQSAADLQLDEPTRRLAARLTVLSAHVDRVEAKIDAEKAARVESEARVDKQLADLIELIMLANDKDAPAQASEPQAPATAVPEEPATASEDDEAQAMAAKVLAETAAEERAIAEGKVPAAPPPPSRPTPVGKAGKPGKVVAISQAAPETKAPDGAAS